MSLGIILVIVLLFTATVVAPIGPITKSIQTKTQQVLGIAPAATTTPKTANPYGIAAGGSLGELSDSELDARMAGIKATGASWVRFDFDWSNIQPDSKASYSWNAYDRLVNSATSHGLTVLGILDFTPSWARVDGCDSSHCAPADANAYASFAVAAVTRYKDKGVHAWEIWNEPNNPQFWQPKADANQYTKLLTASYAAMHRADSSAVVITAGLSPQSDSDTSLSPISFVKQMYANGAHGSFDALADHPYTFPLTPASSGDHAWSQMVTIHSIMASNGDGDKKIWITEFGSPTGGPGPVATPALDNLDDHPYSVDEALQAKILSDAIRLYSSYDWAGPFMYYSYQDAGTTNDTNENFFGLVKADGTKKQAYQVFYDAAHK